MYFDQPLTEIIEKLAIPLPSNVYSLTYLKTRLASENPHPIVRRFFTHRIYG
jgi:hypothetical protein